MARFATLPEAAVYLRMSERTMRRLRERGLVPSSNPTGGHVLFDLDELDEWVGAAKDQRPAARNAAEFALAGKRLARNRRHRASHAAAGGASAASPGPGGADTDTSRPSA